MTLTPPVAGEVSDGPRKDGIEWVWRLRTGEGRVVVVAELLPELARDEAVRRRYVRDVERLATLAVEGVAAVEAFGPGGPGDRGPWRMRPMVAGERLDRWLERRAPAPVDEVASWGARLCDVLARVHAAGWVVRSLGPRNVVVGTDAVHLVDFGLSRVERLSTRTAASLLLEASPYAAPEQLLQRVVDPRTDVYAVGAMLWHGIFGAPPHGDVHPLLREEADLPDPETLRPGVPEEMVELLRACLAEDPEARPMGAEEVAAALRGTAWRSPLPARTACQRCGAALFVGQRLCVTCGRTSVVVARAGKGEGVCVVLESIDEDVEKLGALRRMLAALADGPVPPLNFLVGDERMYSKHERKTYLRTPLVLLADLTPDSGEELVRRMRAEGLDVRARPSREPPWRQRLAASAPWAFGGAMLLGIAAVASGWVRATVAAKLALAVAAVGTVSAALVRRLGHRRLVRRPPLVEPRSMPAALPASDPWVRRIADLVRSGVAPDVRERLGECALWIQRLADHRASMSTADARTEAGLADETIERLVEAIERVVGELADLDARLSALDEADLARAAYAGEVRDDGAARTAALERLDGLRDLEIRRERAYARLIEATRLLRRAAGIGLAVRDEAADRERDVVMALAKLASP